MLILHKCRIQRVYTQQPTYASIRKLLNLFKRNNNNTTCVYIGVVGGFDHMFVRGGVMPYQTNSSNLATTIHRSSKKHKIKRYKKIKHHQHLIRKKP
jgi:hypothetical protein